jgi:hypothetical protein
MYNVNRNPDVVGAVPEIKPIEQRVPLNEWPAATLALPLPSRFTVYYVPKPTLTRE